MEKTEYGTVIIDLINMFYLYLKNLKTEIKALIVCVWGINNNKLSGTGIFRYTFYTYK